MDSRIKHVLRELTRDGEVPTLAAAQEVVDNSTNKVGLIQGVLLRSRYGDGEYLVSDEDRTKLDSVEHAGTGMCWSFTMEVGNGESGHLAAITADGSRHGIRVDRTSVVRGTHLTVSDDGCLVLWSPAAGEDAEGVVAVALGTHDNPAKLADSLAITPLSPDGSPMMHDARMEQAISALGAIAQHLLGPEAPDRGYL